MALLTIPQVGKGLPGTITLNKTELFALPSIAADDYFSNPDNVKKCIIYYVSDEGGQAGQKKTLEFDLSQEVPSASILISARGKNSFSIKEIVLEDFDEGFLHVPFEEIPIGLGVSTLPAPRNLSYSGSNVHYYIGAGITANSPSVDGTVTSWSISPELPAGLSFNSSNGQISGTPSVSAASRSYVVTASNVSGSTSTSVVILVTVAPPTELTYSTVDDHYYIGSQITPNEPLVTGSVASWSISPALPAGLSFNTSNGAISGTPSASASKQTYTVTASNAGGSASTTVDIRVTYAAPSTLSYSAPSPHYYIDSEITPNVPSVTGTVSSWSIDPALPSGLSFNTSTGAITGTPTSSAASSVYTVTASNDGGSTTANLTIVCTNVAPSDLSYASSDVTYTIGTQITANTPTVTGPAIYSISPALPAGLSIDQFYGRITGTPTTASAAATYTVTATNDGGSTTTTIQIRVVNAAPSSLSYSASNPTYVVGTQITNNTPSVTGVVSSWSISPALPYGLSFNTSTGVISGTPNATASSQSYTITASNDGGSTTASVTILVNPAAPTSLSYEFNNQHYYIGSAISNNTPTFTGTVTSWSISPALPTGLSFNTSTGVISGTPSASAASQSYTITASNVTGSTTASVTFYVTKVAPSSLSYSTSSAQYTSGTAITNNTPTVTGTVTSWSISPSLPTGLSFNTSTGVISGTPDGASSTTSYTITASNDGGSTTATISISVVALVWPFGTLGDLTVLANQTVTLNPGQVYDYNNIKVEVGGILQFAGSINWGILGCKGNFENKGTVRFVGLDSTSATTKTIKAPDDSGNINTTGDQLSWTLPAPNAGGAGGNNTWFAGRTGGAQAYGNGGGGAGDDYYAGWDTCPGDETFVSSGSVGGNASATVSGAGGTDGTNGWAAGVSSLGARGNDGLGFGGGSGGFRGGSGGPMYIKIAGTLSGSGKFTVEGQKGGDGGIGTACGGGGGAGGHGGAIYIRVKTNNFLGALSIATGAAGAGGAGYTQAGSTGAAGSASTLTVNGSSVSANNVALY